MKKRHLFGGEVFSFKVKSSRLIGGLAAIAGLLPHVPLRTARWSNRPRYDVRRVPLAMCAISIEGVSHENAHAQN
jgi:hypothetical protein